MMHTGRRRGWSMALAVVVYFFFLECLVCLFPFSLHFV